MPHTPWNRLNNKIIDCDRCPRLRDHCAQIARQKRRAYLDWQYWGKPVPNFGDIPARLLIVGLAPAAHGANRTGQMFTGDRSGDWLFRGLHKAGFASHPAATSREDDLQLTDCVITAVCHCAPPGNQPDKEELVACRDWLHQTIDMVQPRVFLALGQIAWKGLLDELIERSWYSGRRPKFSHAARESLSGDRWMLASYHPSQQNTFTGRLTEPMLDAVFRDIRQLLDDSAIQ